MSSQIRRLIEAREARDAAKTAFDAQLSRLRGDPSAQSAGAHIAGRLGDDARATFEQALDVASESKGVIAGTIAALALWLLRHPIVAWIEQHLGETPLDSDPGDDTEYTDKDTIDE